MATRRERVILELEDQFTTGMARAAASAALLNRELDSLSHDAVRTRRSLSDIDSASTRFGTNAGRTGNQIDRLSGRMRILADVAAILGPSLVPIGGVGLAAVSGLAAQFGFAATGALTAVLAFQGVGDTLKTLNAAALDPTTANLEKAQVALERLTPEAQAFVSQLGSMIPEFRRLRETAAEGLFPGLTEGLDALEGALPRVERIVASVSSELGDIGGDVGAALASDRWAPFLDFLAREAPSALSDMAEAAGNTVHALAALWMATDPVNDDFSRWIVDATADLDRWAQGLGQTQGFADFLSYVETTGPKVAETFGAIANAVVQILQAAAPLGGPVLQGVEALADVVAAFASSDLGTPLLTAVAALALFNRTLGLTRAIAGTTWGGMVAGELKASLGVRTLIGDLRILNRESRIVSLPGKNFIGPLTQAQAAAARLKSTLPAVAKSAALISGVAIASTGAADKIGLTNAASLALMGTFISPGWGTAIGGAIGGTIDLTHASDDLEDSLNRVRAAAESGDFSTYEAEAGSLEKRLKDLQELSGVGDAIGDGLERASQALKHPKDVLSVFGADSSPTKRIADDLAKARIDAEAGRARAAALLLRDGFVATADGAEKAAQSAEDFRRGLEDLNATLSGRASLRDYEQAIDDFAERAQKRAELLGEVAQAQKDLAGARTPEEKTSARQRIADLKEQADALKYSMDIGLQAGRDTQELLDRIVAKGVSFAETITNPVRRTEFLAGVRTQLIAAATQAGYTEGQIDDLLGKFDDLNGITSTAHIVIDADGAYDVITEVERRLNRLARRDARLRLLLDPYGKLQAGGGRDGDPDTPFAEGGWTGPGPKYRPAGVVHAEEFVVKRGPASKFRPWLEHINRLPGYADGGSVQPFPRAMPGGPAIDYDRLAAAMSNARPMYGDAHFYGDYTQHRRQMEMDKRAASVGGMPRG